MTSYDIPSFALFQDNGNVSLLCVRVKSKDEKCEVVDIERTKPNCCSVIWQHYIIY